MYLTKTCGSKLGTVMTLAPACSVVNEVTFEPNAWNMGITQSVEAWVVSIKRHYVKV